MNKQKISHDTQLMLDEIWLNHFARAIHKEGVFDDEQYNKLLDLIRQEIGKRKRRLTKGDRHDNKGNLL